MMSSKYKILMGHNFYQEPGGEDTVFRSEVALLQNQGHTIIEFIKTNHDIKNLNTLEAAIHTIWSNPIQNRIMQILNKERPQIAHFHNTFLLMSPSVYYGCKELNVPVIQTIHNYRLICPTATFFRDAKVCNQCLGKLFPWPAIRHACYRHSRLQSGIVSTMLAFHRIIKTWENQVDVFITLTDFSRRKLIEGGILPDKIITKPNFVYPDPGLGSLINRKERFALFVGRLTQEKGVLTLLNAWQELKGIKTTKLLIVGDGPLRDKMRDFISSNDLHNIEMLGWLSHKEVLSLLKTANFLIFPSEWYEALPTIILEAFACGLPVIASRLGAMGEIVQHQITGLHFAPGEVIELANTINWAIINYEKMRKMGHEARLDFEKKYTAEHNYKLLLSIYDYAQKIIH